MASIISGTLSSSPPIPPFIGESKLKDSIRELFALLYVIKISDLKKIYESLFQLFPHFNSDEFEKLKGYLPKLLELSKDLPEEQQQLALKLAYRQIEKAHTHSNPFFFYFDYHEGMDYFAKALQTAEHRKDRQQSNDIHRSASFLIVESYFGSGVFKSRLEEARRLGDLDRFDQILSQIDQLARFCCDEQDKEVMRSFYNQALDFLIDTIPDGQRDQYGPFVEKLRERRDQSFEFAEEYATQRYGEGLRAFRDSFKLLNSSNVKIVQGFQKTVTTNLRNFLRIFLEDIFAILGPPPCAYDIRAMGSLGREEPCPFSDIEIFILVENEKSSHYFECLLLLFELQIRSLGETKNKLNKIGLVFTSVHTKNPEGFHLDPGGNPSDFIGTPLTLARLQESGLGSANDPSTLAHTALKTVSLCSTNIDLYQQYQLAIVPILDTPKEEGDLLLVRHHRAIELFKTRLQDFEKTWPQPHLSPTVHLKKQYLELLHYLLADMSLYWGIEATNTLDIVDALVERKIFTRESGDLLKEAVAKIYVIRIRLHQRYEEQNEEAYLSGVQGYNLQQREKTELAKIYWLVLRPLYFRLGAVLKEGKKLEEVFYKLDLFRVVFEEVFSQDRPEVLKPLMSHLAAYLIEIRAPVDEHAKYLRQLSQQIKTEPLREAYFETLENYDLSPEILEKLAIIPNRSGLRLSFLRRRQKFQATLQAMTTLEPLNVGEIQVKVIGSSTRYLRPETISQILDKNGDLKWGYLGTAHAVAGADLVIGKTGLHFKRKPTHSLMEYAIHNLFYRIAGHLTPATELVRFEVTVSGKQKIYPVLISETVFGKTLKMLEQEQTLKLDPEQWARWTWMLLCSLLTRPGDGRSSNYVLDVFNNIFCVDNDISFVEPVVQESFSKKVNFCSALFCLFSERPLDLEVLKEFCSLDIDAILNSWIEEVIEKEKSYLRLFSEEEQKKLYDEDEKNRFKATILFRAGTLATLNLQFFRLQNYILHQKKPITPADLLKQLISLREASTVEKSSGIYVMDVYKKAHRLPLSIDEKLKQITGRKEDKSLLSFQSDQACLGRVPTFEEVKKQKLLTPKKAREELLMNLLNRRSNAISLGVVQGKKVIQASFKDMVQRKIPDMERQRLVLQALTYYLEIDPPKPNSITLHYCAALDSLFLDPFLHPDLEYLDLSFCPQIKDRDVETISQKCPHLHTLYLRGCSQLRNLVGSGVFSTYPVDFSKQEFKILAGHTLGVSTLISLDSGKKLVSGSYDKTIRIWDVESGKELKILRHTGAIKTLISLEGEKKLASVNDNNIRIWDIESGKQLKMFTELTGSIKILISLDGGKKLASGSEDGTIRIWDVQSGIEFKIFKGDFLTVSTLTSLDSGKKLAMANGNTIRIWDAESGKQLKILKNDNILIFSVPVLDLVSLEGGKKLISKYGEQTTLIWDVESEESKILSEYRRPDCTLFALEGGKKLASAGSKGVIYIWDIEIRKNPKILTGHTDSAHTFICLEGGKKLVSGSYDKTIRIWDVESGRELKRLIHKWTVSSLTSLEGGKKLVSGDMDVIRIWDLEAGLEHLFIEQCENLQTLRLKAPLKTLSANKNPQLKNVDLGSEITSFPQLDFEQCAQLNLKQTLKDILDKVLKSQTRDIFPTLLRPSIWIALAEIVEEDSSCNEKLFSLIESSKMDPYMSTSAANAITILNLAHISFLGRDFQGIRIPGAHLEGALLSGTNLRDADLAGVNLSNAVLSYAQLDKTQMEKVQFNPPISSEGEKKMASENGDEILFLTLDIKPKKELKILKGHTGTVRALICLESEKKMVSGGDDKTLRIWDMESGKELRILKGHTGDVVTLITLDGGKKLASGSRDNTIHIWDVKSGKELGILKGHMGSVLTLSSLSSGKMLASGSLDNSIRIWDFELGKELRILEGHTAWVRTLISLEGGKKLASGSDDNTIRIWDVESGKELKMLMGHTYSIWALISLEGGKKIASGSRCDIWIWDLKSEKKLKMLTGHTHTVLTLIALEDGKKLVSGSSDNTIRIWDIETGRELLSIVVAYPIIALASNGPDFLYAGDDHGGLWCWKLNLKEPHIPPQLLWATHPTLDCTGVDISNVLGLSEVNERLMIEHGAKK